jgi:hypothetical protein
MMRTIAEQNVFLRMRVELPVGLKLTTHEFHEGWNFVTGDASRLEKKVRIHGWNFIKIADGTLKSGVGETSQEAIASALKLGLRRMSAHFNAVEVEHIELTQYPWFYLARVRIYPYRIQQDAVLPVPDELQRLPIAPRQRRLPLNSAALYPEFGSAMPQLKQMLVLSGQSKGEPYPPSCD